MGDTPIVTTVHEAQIVEKVPLKPHDKLVNMIVTPERVVRIDRA
jgi:5-formyltetrahydrofolate cyclo-ligase